VSLLDDLQAEIVAMRADLQRARARFRAHVAGRWDEDAGSDTLGVREPVDRGPAPRVDQAAVHLPAMHARLDAVGTTAGKAATTEKRR
jgi:hypothetical protein